VDAATTIPNKIVRHRGNIDAVEDDSALSVPNDKTLCGVTDYHVGFGNFLESLYMEEKC